MSRILVIDDELSIRHTVLDAADGREGMALWRREPIDVVVTAIFMPGSDGLQVLIEMKKVAKTQDHRDERGRREGPARLEGIRTRAGGRPGACKTVRPKDSSLNHPRGARWPT